MFFSKKIFLRFLSLRYGADFGRSRLVIVMFQLIFQFQIGEGAEKNPHFLFDKLNKFVVINT